MPHDSKYFKLRFIQLLPNVPTTGDFLLRDLPGTGKRIDILCRDLAACFDWGPSVWPRSQIEFTALISDSIILTFQNPGDNLPSGERGWALIVKEALRGNQPDFVSIEKGNLDTIIKELHRPPSILLWVLHEEGQAFSHIETQLSETQNSFMLGDYRGFDSQSEELISSKCLARVSLGSTSYLSSHCVASIISKFERMVK